MNINPIFLKDFYKTSHHKMYPPGTNLIFSNFTPRKSRMSDVNHSVFFGLTYFIEKYLKDEFNKEFFYEATSAKQAWDYEDVMGNAIGDHSYPEHIEKLHNLGYLPIAIYALPEGSIVPCGVPAFVMFNTHPDFYWLPGMLETLLSCTLWQACTSATIAREYRELLDQYALETSDQPDFVDYQAHDFSMRGMSSVESAIISGMAHLRYFKGTDTIPALLANREYYGVPLSAASVPATEHSIMSAGGKEDELETYRRLLHLYPNGILSVVSDTWDLWNVISNILPALKDQILKRNGKLVIRPDSGNPADIICGDNYIGHKNAYKQDAQSKGVVESLWDLFGGKVNSKGYKELDSHIGVIYGDSITLQRAKDICERLKAKRFCTNNIVFGIGSYTYQYNTRDTLGWAMKATYCEINGQGRAITKDPITDDGTKRSHSGLLKVVQDKESFKVLQNQTWDEFYSDNNELKLVF